MKFFTRYCCAAIAACLALLFLLDAGLAVHAADKDQYHYRRTRQAVLLINEAVSLIEEKGEAAFANFGEKDSRWFYGETYVFVYTMDGVNLFHPVEEHLRGKDLYDLTDVDGRPMVRQLIEKARNGGGWVHYMWARPDEFIPTWKSGYVRKAVIPDGREVFVGTGVYNLPTEKRFIVEMVDDATVLIDERGKEAFELFRNRSGPFTFRDSYVFIFKDNGTAVVDPAFPLLEGRNLLKYENIQKMIKAIKGEKSAWASYMRPKPGEVNASKKLAYLKAVFIEGDRYIVGADFFPPKPIWMR